MGQLRRAQTQPSPVSRRLLVPLGLGTGLSLLGDSTLYTVLPEPAFHSQLGVTVGTVGLLLGVNRLVRLAFNGLAGSLFDRHSGKGLLLVSMLIGVAANLSYVIGFEVRWVLVGRVLWGAAWAGIWVGSHAILLDATTVDDRGQLSGRYQLWFFLGVGATSLAGGALADLVGFRRTLWLAVASCGLAFLIWLFFLPESRGQRPSRHKESPAEDGWESFPWRPTLAASLPYFSIRITTAGVLASTTILWLGRYLGEGSLLHRVGLPLATLTGAMVALRMLVGMAIAPLSGWLSDRLRRRWGVLAASLAIGSAGLGLMTSAVFLPALAGALFLAVMGPAVHGLSPSILGDRVGTERRGRALGVMFTLGDLGSALGPPLALGLLPAVGLEFVYLISAVLLLMTTLFAGVMSRWEDPLPAS